MTKTNLSLLFASLLLLVSAGVAEGAEAGDKILRFGARFVSTSEGFGQHVSFDSPTTSGHVQVGAGDGGGFDVTFEYLVTDRVGLATSVSFSAHYVDMDWNAPGWEWPEWPDQPWNWEIPWFDWIPDLVTDVAHFRFGHVSMMPVTVGANYHFATGERIDVYAGPFVGYVIFTDVVTEASTDVVGTHVGVQSDFGYGAVLGADVPFGKKRKWMVSLATKYLETEIDLKEGGGRSTLDVDPWSLQIGFGYRF